MRVIKLTTNRQLKAFVSLPDELYKGDKFYVPYMRRDLLSTLKKLTKEGYVALAAEENGKLYGRILVTVAHNKQLGKQNCGFFSHFECVNDVAVCRLLLEGAAVALKEMGADYMEGSYFPYDQDNRRGILVQGFDHEPMILTSYNPPYYPALFEACGFKKDFDTVSYRLSYDRYDIGRIRPLTERLLGRYGLEISPADFSRLDREIDDVHAVISEATNDIIFQDAPTREDLVRIVKNWRSFLWPDFILICRRKEDGRPVGVMMSIPNYFSVFRAMKGRTGPVALIRAAFAVKKIDSVRAMLQYVVPEYQNKGVNFALYQAFYEACRARGIATMEAGTIMENNDASRRNVEKASGELDKIFRLYGRKI